MKQARYVLRIDHRGGATPELQREWLGRVRDRLAPLGAELLNLRVSRRAVEFDLFCSPDQPLEPYLAALKPLGPLLSQRRIDLPPAPAEPEAIVQEARRLFNEERYWEVHEVLEDLWKRLNGPEKQLVQGLILAAAALVHAQKNEPGVAFTMLADAARRLEDQPQNYFGWDIAAFAAALNRIITSKNIHFPTV
jgi:hypothetical protein